MSRADYEKLKKNENDSTVTDIQLTTDGVKDFGYGQPYSTLNTDTLCNGKRKRAYGLWSPDSRYFLTNISDDRNVKELWVINSVAEPRPTLETYKYQMPGEKEARRTCLPLRYDRQLTQRNRHKKIQKPDHITRLHYHTVTVREACTTSLTVWLGDNNRFFLTRSSRDLHRIDICSYTIGSDTIVPVIEERMNTYQEVRPLGAIAGGKELVQWSERDGWAHLYLYDDKGNLKRRLTEGSRGTSTTSSISTNLRAPCISQPWDARKTSTPTTSISTASASTAAFGAQARLRIILSFAHSRR